MSDMIQEEARTRLSRIPFALIRLAAARIPRELREDLADEWNAELEHVLTGNDDMPVTWLVRGIRCSACLLISGREIMDCLTGGEVGRAWRLIRRVLGGAERLVCRLPRTGTRQASSP